MICMLLCLQIDPDPEFRTVSFPNPEEGAVVLVRRRQTRGGEGGK